MLDGVRLAYGRKTGYGSYGPTQGPHGARVLRLRAGDASTAAAESWIAEAGGARVEQAPASAAALVAVDQDGCPNKPSHFCEIMPNTASCRQEAAQLSAAAPAAPPEAGDNQAD